MRFGVVFALAACGGSSSAGSDASVDATDASTDGPAGTGTVAIVRDFDGVAGPAYKDHPDLGGAVGRNHVVDFTGSDVVVRDKLTGAVVTQHTQNAFWAAAGITPGTLNDPRLVFDPLADRWYGVTAGPYPFLAVSSDVDPTKPWHAVALTTQVTGDLLARVGFDVNGVYVCSYGGNLDSICFAIPKLDATAAGGPVLTREAIFANQPFELFPAIDLDPHKAPDAPEALLTRQGGQAGGIPMVLVLLTITWNSTTAMLGAPMTIPTGMTYDLPGSSAQPAGSPPIRGAEDHRFMGVFASGSSIFSVHGSQLGSHVGAEWFEVRVSDGTLVQSGTLADPNADILFPTLAVDAAGDVGIAFTRTSSSEAPSIYIAERTASDPPNTLRAPIRATAGTHGYACTMNPVGWGTYSTTMRDPSDPMLLWAYQQYGATATACAWATHWVAFTL